MDKDAPVPSNSRPWYYRPEFFYPLFIFPPVWSVLVLRSPWNKNVVMGGVAWAILIVGVVMSIRWVQEGVPQAIILLFFPGTILTIVTQVQWARYKHEHASAVGQGDNEDLPQSDIVTHARPPRPTARRRGRRRIGR